MVDPIRETVTVRCSPERAFQLFTEMMDRWWPVDELTGRERIQGADQFTE
jgi:hypothetical protein